MDNKLLALASTPTPANLTRGTVPVQAHSSLRNLPLITEAQAQALVEDAAKLLCEKFSYTRAEGTQAKSNGKLKGIYPPATQEEIQAALNVTPSDDYEIWYQNGCGLCNEFGKDGFALFEAWSKKSKNITPANVSSSGRLAKRKLPKAVAMARAQSKYYANMARPGSQEASAVKSGKLIQSSGEFVKDFTPPDYLIDGLLQRHFIYSLTGPTGSGKTAMALRLGMHVALGLPLDKGKSKRRAFCSSPEKTQTMCACAILNFAKK